MDRLHAFCYFLEGLLPRAAESRCAAALRDGIELLRLASCAISRPNSNAPTCTPSCCASACMPIGWASCPLIALPPNSRPSNLPASRPWIATGRHPDEWGILVRTQECRAAAVHQSGLGSLRLPGPGIVGGQPRRLRPAAPPLADLTLNSKIKLAFASGTEDLNRRLIEHVRAIYPELPLWVVSDFPPEDPGLKWIRYRVNRPFAENLRRCREELRGHEIRLAAVMLVPNVPFRRMRLLALVLSPRGFLAFNENLNHFMLRPGSHAGDRAAHRVAGANALRWSVRTARKTDWARGCTVRRRECGRGCAVQATAPHGRGSHGATPIAARDREER